MPQDRKGHEAEIFRRSIGDSEVITFAINWVEIIGFRGFADSGRIEFAIPSGKPGSGLTIIVGPNNSGKSTVIEALSALSQERPPSFSEGKRNAANSGRISIKLCNDKGEVKKLSTVEAGGSETEWSNVAISPRPEQIFTLPARRAFSPYFHKFELDRSAYVREYGLHGDRGKVIDHFNVRIFHMHKNQQPFNKELARVLSPLPEWTVDQADSGSYYLKFTYDNQTHSSEGLGEGLISLFFIVDALYDSSEGDIIAIDEPELSLHPSLQKNLANLLADYAKTRQIVLATHSPHFIDWNWILTGAKVVRVVREPNTIYCHQLKDTYLHKVEGLLRNLNNPHILGLEAKEVFFLDDNVILVEGQEDVVWYKRIAHDLGVELSAEFYGWGVGGAGNMSIIAGILKELGFRNVAGILDKDKQSECDKVSKEFPDYMFKVIPTDDVRSRGPVKAKDAVEGLVEGDCLKEEYQTDILNMFSDIKARFAL